MKFEATYKVPDEGPWTRWDEIRQRLGNCRRMLAMAWWALRYDSVLFATCVFNSVRDEGDLTISRIVLKSGREFDNL